MLDYFDFYFYRSHKRVIRQFTLQFTLRQSPIFSAVYRYNSFVAINQWDQSIATNFSLINFLQVLDVTPG